MMKCCNQSINFDIDAVTTKILGMPNFICSIYARSLRNHGHEIHNKSESEQAYVILWLLSMYKSHGDRFMLEVNSYITSSKVK